MAYASDLPPVVSTSSVSPLGVRDVDRLHRR